MKNESSNQLKDNLIQQIELIAREAGELIMDVYANFSEDMIEWKSDESPLTKADKMANDHIVEKLGQLDEVYPVISEERKIVDYSERSQYEKYWVVDPLDGTKEFIKRNGEFTVNIALCEGGRPILGVVYVPAQGVMYSARSGQGASKMVNQSREAIQAQSFPKPGEKTRVVVSRSHMNDQTKDFVNQFEEVELIPTGSSLKFMMVAEGKADCYPRLGPTMEWDTCAAQIIVEEAGGSVINEETQKPLNYNKENLLNPFFIVWGRRS